MARVIFGPAQPENRESVMGLMSRKSDPNSILDRIADPSNEPEVQAAAEARGRADSKAEALAKDLAALTNRIDAAEREMAAAILDGESTDGGEDLPALRLARRSKLEEFELSEKVAQVARERLQEAASAAKERLRKEFEALYRREVKGLAKELDEAMNVNVRVRDLRYRAAQLGVNVPELFYVGLVPATPRFHSRFADWRAGIDRFLSERKRA